MHCRWLRLWQLHTHTTSAWSQSAAVRYLHTYTLLLQQLLHVYHYLAPVMPVCCYPIYYYLIYYYH